MLLGTLATTAVLQWGWIGEKEGLIAEKQGLLDSNAKLIDEQGRLIKEIEEALDKAKEAHRQRLKSSALTLFRHGHEQCASGQIQQGLIYLVESLKTVEHKDLTDDEDAKKLAITIRQGIATWRREVHDLTGILKPGRAAELPPVQSVVVSPSGSHVVTVTGTPGGNS